MKAIKYTENPFPNGPILTMKGIYKFLKVSTSILLLQLTIAGCNTTKKTDATKTKPNVIIILTDDQGYGDMSCHGNPIVQTPNIDRMHDESTRFSQFMVSPLCQPSRCSLMTGRNKVIGRRIEQNEQTLAQMFKRGGYTTSIFGKWHLGEYYPYRPIDKGYDEMLIIGGGGITQVQDYWGNAYFDPYLNNNGKWEKHTGFCTDVLFDQALTWIEKQKDTSFFCYLSTNAAHEPFFAPEKYRKKFLEKGLTEEQASFYGMIENFDDNLGKLQDRMRSLGIHENTLVVFLTDNGSTMGYQKEKLYNANLRGGKSSIYEGGSRAAAFFNWPGKLKRNKSIDQLAMHYDILPTLADICDIPLLSSEKDNDIAPLDGISLKSFLFDEKKSIQERHHVTYQGFWPPNEPLLKYKNTSIRSQNYRLANGTELYNLRDDPSETTNIGQMDIDRVNGMKSSYDKWWAKMSPKLNDLRVYNPYPLGIVKNQPSTLCALHYYDSRVLNETTKWFKTRFYEQTGLEAFLKDEASASPQNKPLLGTWKVDFRSKGTYLFTFRKGPRSMPEGLRRINKGMAHILIDEQQYDFKIKKDVAQASFEIEVKKTGEHLIECWFDGQRADEQPSGAYFVDVVLTNQ